MTYFSISLPPISLACNKVASLPPKMSFTFVVPLLQAGVGALGQPTPVAHSLGFLPMVLPLQEKSAGRLRLPDTEKPEGCLHVA